MKIGSLKEFKELETMDFTVNGKCSNCGECCSTLLPVSDDEIKQIRQYIRKHHIKLKHNVKAPMAARTIDLTCPFLDVSKEHKCMHPVSNKYPNATSYTTNERGKRAENSDFY